MNCDCRIPESRLAPPSPVPALRPAGIALVTIILTAYLLPRTGVTEPFIPVLFRIVGAISLLLCVKEAGRFLRQPLVYLHHADAAVHQHPPAPNGFALALGGGILRRPRLFGPGSDGFTLHAYRHRPGSRRARYGLRDILGDEIILSSPRMILDVFVARHTSIGAFLDERLPSAECPRMERMTA